MVPTAALEFNFEGRAVRTVLIDGQTWFVAADVCAVLEHPNPRQVISRLDDDERGVSSVDTPGGRQEVNVVSESGVYNLIFTSRKPQAKAFRRWVTGEVLPSIRKSGRYDARTEDAAPGLNGDDTVQVALPTWGRFIVTMRGKDGVHIHQTDYAADVQEFVATDFEIVCHSLRMIEGFWHKFQQIRSATVDPEGGFALTSLEEGILQGGRLAKHYLRCRQERRG